MFIWVAMNKTTRKGNFSTLLFRELMKISFQSEYAALGVMLESWSVFKDKPALGVP